MTQEQTACNLNQLLSIVDKLDQVACRLNCNDTKNELRGYCYNIRDIVADFQTPAKEQKACSSCQGAGCWDCEGVVCIF